VNTESKRKKKTLLFSSLSSCLDEDTVTGFLLAGVGNVDSKRKSNFLVVGSKTTQGEIEDAFRRFTNPDSKPPVGVLLLAQSVAGEIRHLLDDYNQV
jgi:V-type H+-transporting ATPase subunit F